MPGSCNVMVVEDEALIALDLALTIEELGAAVCGPFDCVDRAVPACDIVDGAILDVDLKGETVFALADRLRALGTPFVFHTGRSDITALRARYGACVPILRKPARLEQLQIALGALIEARLTPRIEINAGRGMRSAS